MIEQYYQSLLQRGVANYSWDECWFDYRLAAVPKFYATIVATVALDNSTPHKKAYRQADLSRLIAFCEDHEIEKLLRKF